MNLVNPWFYNPQRQDHFMSACTKVFAFPKIFFFFAVVCTRGFFLSCISFVHASPLMRVLCT